MRFDESELGYQGFLDRLTKQGWDFSLPRYISHNAHVRTEEDAQALASDLRDAGYVLEFVDEDRDYDRWEISFRESRMAVVTAEVLGAARARTLPIIVARKGEPAGLGVDTTEHERRLGGPDWGA